MPQHHPKNVSRISKWCPTCRRNTMHRVDFKREGSCTEHAPQSGISKKQEAEARKRQEEKEQPKLF